ncbi:hypothetical protein RD792_009343 [Penstemon davidsonii]|uniref:Potassium transporter n=1 Tax=Penstemon davidsonii TaxID=160366 RepID=A0ABR0D052_9LAMI|nr:hypothetical protein RD792_009343 [Penstemon davidsonii]
MSSDVVLHEESTAAATATATATTTDQERRKASSDVESSNHAHPKGSGDDWMVILQLAFQSLGVVYGDLGTSPLYVYPSIFPDGIKDNDDILGALSLIIYTITLLPLIKYVCFVLRANDNGNGGTFALYSLICRYAKVGLIPSQEVEDRQVSTYQLELPNNRMLRASKVKSFLENSNFAKTFLLFATMLGTSMLIGDGVLTPCISVLSAVGGIKGATSAMTEDRIVWISVVILILLFMVQRFGTDKVGYTFAPIICVWFFLISGIGIYNFIKYDPSVIKALNPMYIIYYFMRNKKKAWISLGGCVLSITGTEALFADLGHFSVKSIQISMCTLIYPAVVLSYVGQSSYLRENNLAVSEAFYKSIPVIASQALISGTFSIIQQSLALGCFPRVKVVHTSAKYKGQVYVPEINYLLMLACVFVTLGFKDTVKIGNAYGIAVVFVMCLTSAYLVLVMIILWKTHILFIFAYILIIGSVELAYLSSVLYKFSEGGYLPLAFALFLVSIMYTWNYVYRKKYYFELNHKISSVKVHRVIAETNSRRLPGMAIFYSELVHGIPPIFEHYIANVPALHSILVFVSVKSLPISKVPVDERFLFRRVLPKNLLVFRCVVRYGYTDVRNEQEPFESLLIERLKNFIKEDHVMGLAQLGDNDEPAQNIRLIGDGDEIVNEEEEGGGADREIEALDRATEAGVVHLVGEHDVVAAKGASIGKRILIDYGYSFLKRNLRQSNEVFDIPHKKMLKVGMIYEL